MYDREWVADWNPLTTTDETDLQWNVDGTVLQPEVQ